MNASDNPTADLFSADFFSSNRSRLWLAAGSDGPAVITANGLLQRNGDSPFEFRQDSNFWYLTGVEEPDVLLLMDGKKSWLVVPPRDDVRAAFDGAVDMATLAERAGVDEVLSEEEGWKKISGWLAKHGTIASLDTPPAYDERHGLYVNPARARLIKRLQDTRAEVGGKADAPLDILDLRPNLMALRSHKQPEELQAIQQAIDITIDGFKYVMAKPHLEKYQHEFEVEADLTQQFKRRGGSNHAYGAIVAGGQRACMLHNVANSAPLRKDDLLLMDVGAEVSNYAADITRTISLSGRPSSRQKAVVEAVIQVQEHALGLLKPGAVLKDYEADVEAFLGEKLRELGVLKSADKPAIRKFYPHAASHFLGLDVHDVGDYMEPLEAGMVLTCEPGIYLPEEGIGVRIEDDVLITPEGNDVLSRNLPREI